MEFIIHADDKKMIIHFERNGIEVDRSFFMVCLGINSNRIPMTFGFGFRNCMGGKMYSFTLAQKMTLEFGSLRFEKKR